MHTLALAGTIIIAATLTTLYAAELTQPTLPPAVSQTPAPAAEVNDSFRVAGRQQAGHAPSPARLTSIVTWLTTNFDLAPSDALPEVKLAPAWLITARRNRDVLATQGQPSAPDSGRETVAVYDTTERTIYLPEDWRGESPAEISILVHEMVHHLQTLAGTRFECPQAREQLAYAAQQRWLELFGRNLEEDFQLDPFTLLVTMRCMF